MSAPAARRLDRPTKQPFAGLTVFATHSDTVGGTLYSADYEYYMEQTLRAPYAGVLKSLKCKVGDIVGEGVELAEVEPAAA